MKGKRLIVAQTSDSSKRQEFAQISQEARIAMNIRLFMQSTVKYKNITFLFNQNGYPRYFGGLD